MRYIQSLLMLILKAVFKQFRFASDLPVGDTPVLAGIDAIVRHEGKVIAYATGVDFDEDFQLQPILTLGYHGARDFKSLGYTLSFNVNSFVLSGKAVEGSLTTPERATILTTKLTDFEVIDLSTGKALYIIQGCKCAGVSSAFDATALATKTSRWMAKNKKSINAS